MEDMYKKAVFNNLRFPIPGREDGMKLTCEDVAKLPLTSEVGKPNLDEMYIAYHKAIQENEVTSYVRKTAAKAAKIEEANLRFLIVKDIIDTRMAEAEAELKSKEVSQEVAELEEAIRRDKGEAINSMPLADKEKRLAELKAAQGV